jgi:hypothetical protein
MMNVNARYRHLGAMGYQMRATLGRSTSPVTICCGDGARESGQRDRVPPMWQKRRGRHRDIARQQVEVSSLPGLLDRLEGMRRLRLSLTSPETSREMEAVLQ